MTRARPPASPDRPSPTAPCRPPARGGTQRRRQQRPERRQCRARRERAVDQDPHLHVRRGVEQRRADLVVGKRIGGCSRGGGAGARISDCRPGACCASVAAYWASAARPASSAGRVEAFSSTTVPRPAGRAGALREAGSGAVAAVGQVTPMRASRRPSFCSATACVRSPSAAPITSPVPVVASTRWSRAVPIFPPRPLSPHDRQRVERGAVARPVDRGHVDRVDPGALRLAPRERVPAAAQCEPLRRAGGGVRRTVAGFDSQKRTVPRPAFATWNAGGCCS